MVGNTLRLLNNYEIDWTAAAAIATFLAVLVALYPIWDNWRRQDNIRRNIRGQIIIRLQVLRVGLERISHPVVTRRTHVFFNEEISAIRSLEQISSSATILTPLEHDKIMAILGFITLLSATTQSDDTKEKSPSIAKDTLQFTDSLAELLHSHYSRPQFHKS
jgi:hypothetical protein